MSRHTRSVLAAIAIWMAVVAATSTTAWIVIDRTGRGAYLTDGAESALPAEGAEPVSPSTSAATTTSSARRPTATGTPSAGGPARSASPTAPTHAPSGRPAPSPSPSPRATPGATPKPPAPASTPTADSVTVDGGSVGVSCQGAVLTLRFVTPANGWAYQLVRPTDSIEVAFRQQVGEGESEVQARCSHGVPVFETSSSGGGGEVPNE